MYIPGLPGEVPRDIEYRGPYLDLAKRAANRHRIPEALFLRLINQESRWNPKRCRQRGDWIGAIDARYRAPVKREPAYSLAKFRRVHVTLPCNINACSGAGTCGL